jgi:sulfate transport system ATP-binding protein
VVHLGFEVRLELIAATTGDEFQAQITRGDAYALNLKPGEVIYARATKVAALSDS